jgi:hypothetical protein
MVALPPGATFVDTVVEPTFVVRVAPGVKPVAKTTIGVLTGAEFG